MKTLTMKDLILAALTKDQVCSLCSSLEDYQYFDLMMNIGADGEEDQIGVLSKNHVDSKEYMKALCAVGPYDKTFWNNANELVLNINKNIAMSSRRRFHVEDRFLDQKLIEALKTRVPSNQEALDWVTEDTYPTNTPLAMILRGEDNADQLDTTNPCADTDAALQVSFSELSDKRLIVRLHCEPFALRFQPYNAFILRILNEFRKQGTKTITLTKEFLGCYIEPVAYIGFAELDISGQIHIMEITDVERKSMSRPIFRSVTATRLGNSDVPATIPDSMTFEIDNDTWLTLTLQSEKGN